MPPKVLQAYLNRLPELIAEQTQAMAQATVYPHLEAKDAKAQREEWGKVKDRRLAPEEDKPTAWARQMAKQVAETQPEPASLTIDERFEQTLSSIGLPVVKVTV